MSRNTVRKVLKHHLPVEYSRRPRPSLVSKYQNIIRSSLEENQGLPQCERQSIASIYRRLRDHHGYGGGYDSVRRHCRALQVSQVGFVVRAAGNNGAIDSLTIERSPRVYKLDPHAPSGSSNVELRLHRDRRAERANEAADWIDRLRGDRLKRTPDGDKEVIRQLMGKVHDPSKRQRDRATAVLAHEQGFPIRRISLTLDISRNTCRRYLRAYRDGGVDQLFAPMQRGSRMADNELLKATVFRVLHQPPRDYGINRTSWIMSDLRTVVCHEGLPASYQVLRQIIRDAGWKWRKARIVLTSRDPAYGEKLAAVKNVLSSLASDEAFFSIDEFGPLAVKMKQGLMLGPPGPQRIVPQWQKSKGCLIVTAALELSGNQISHFYSKKKNTKEMIRMMELLIDRYAGRRTLSLSWDAASWHISKELKQRVDKHNETAGDRSRPRVEIVPLPAGAQFLNVIESVFSGMARSIIHNSDYPSVDDARSAIDQYFSDRNEQFRKNPKRAGKRIWEEERVPSQFCESNNCKDPRWR